MHDPAPEPPAAPDPARHLRTLRVVWGGIAAAGLWYAAALWYMSTLQDRAVSLPALFEYGLTAAGGLFSLGSFLLRPLLLRPRRIAAAREAGGLRRAFATITTGYLMVWAVADAAAVLGLVLGFLGGRPAVAYGLIATGVALVLAHAPTAHTVPDLLAAAERERLRNMP